MTGERGRVVGRSVGEIVFRARHDADLKLGEVLKVTSEREPERVLFVRVLDVLHGADALEAQWAERTAGMMMELDRDGAPFTFADRDRRLYKVGVAAPLGWWDGERFRKPKSIPDHFATVHGCASDDFGFLAGRGGDLVVGALRSGDAVLEVPVGVPARMVPYHVGVFATTGMGKSNLMKVLAAAMLESGRAGLLLLDPHGEFYDGGSGSLPDGRPLRGLSHHPLAAERLEVYSSRPLPGRHHAITLSAYEVHPNDVRAIYTFSPPQNEALEAVWAQQGDHWLTYLGESDEKLIIADLGGGNRFYEGTIGVLKRRAERILGWQEFVHRDPKVSTTRRIVGDLHAGRTVLVDTSSLWEDQELLISACLARRLLNANKALYRDREAFERTPPVLVTLEEAQRVLGRAAGEANVFASLAREGRKFKVGLCAITQQPKLLSEELLSQFNTLVVMGLSDERDRAILRGSAKQDIGALGKEIQTLEAGEAILTSPHAPFAVPTRIFLYEDVLARRAPGEPRARVAVDRAFY